MDVKVLYNVFTGHILYRYVLKDNEDSSVNIKDYFRSSLYEPNKYELFPGSNIYPYDNSYGLSCDSCSALETEGCCRAKYISDIEDLSYFANKYIDVATGDIAELRALDVVIKNTDGSAVSYDQDYQAYKLTASTDYNIVINVLDPNGNTDTSWTNRKLKIVVTKGFAEPVVTVTNGTVTVVYTSSADKSQKEHIICYGPVVGPDDTYVPTAQFVLDIAIT